MQANSANSSHDTGAPGPSRVSVGHDNSPPHSDNSEKTTTSKASTSKKTSNGNGNSTSSGPSVQFKKQTKDR